MADDTADTIRDSITKPKRVSGDEGSVEAHSLSEQLDALERLEGREAASGSVNPGRGLMVTRLRAPGAG